MIGSIDGTQHHDGRPATGQADRDAPFQDPPPVVSPPSALLAVSKHNAGTDRKNGGVGADVRTLAIGRALWSDRTSFMGSLPAACRKEPGGNRRGAYLISLQPLQQF